MKKIILAMLVFIVLISSSYSLEKEIIDKQVEIMISATEPVILLAQSIILGDISYINSISNKIGASELVSIGEDFNDKVEEYRDSETIEELTSRGKEIKDLFDDFKIEVNESIEEFDGDYKRAQVFELSVLKKTKESITKKTDEFWKIFEENAIYILDKRIANAQKVLDNLNYAGYDITYAQNNLDMIKSSKKDLINSIQDKDRDKIKDIQENIRDNSKSLIEELKKLQENRPPRDINEHWSSAGGRILKVSNSKISELNQNGVDTNELTMNYEKAKEYLNSAQNGLNSNNLKASENNLKLFRDEVKELAYAFQRVEGLSTSSFELMDSLSNSLGDSAYKMCKDFNEGNCEEEKKKFLMTINIDDEFHSADTDKDWKISTSELTRIIQFYNIGSYSCQERTEDGYVPGPGDQTCGPHDSDYTPQDWKISTSELMRLTQFYNSGSYHTEFGTEDGFAPGELDHFTNLIWDIDGNGKMDGGTDSILIQRFLYGLTGDGLLDDAVEDSAKRDGNQIEEYLNILNEVGALDVDGNGISSHLTDGLLITRYMFEFTGDVIIDGAIGEGATRTTASDIMAFLENPVLTFVIPLKEGWNLKSLPVEVEFDKLSDIFSSIDGKYQQIKTVTKSATIIDGELRGDLTELHAGDGFQILVTEDATLKLTGTLPESADSHFSSLEDGWHMSGITSLEDKPINEFIDLYNIIALYRFKDGSKEDELYGRNFTEFEPGKGYKIMIGEGICEGDYCVPSEEEPPITLSVTPENIEAAGLYETYTFTCHAGERDPDCTKQDLPTWSVSGCGKIDGSSQGTEIKWNTGHGDCKGTLILKYNGETKSTSLKATIPEEVSPDFQSHITLPQMTDKEVLKICESQDPYSKDSTFYKKQIADANELSDKLEEYIRGWLNGDNPAEIPKGFLPDTIDNEKTHSWKLYKPDDISSQEQWYYYPARENPEENNWAELRKNSAAPHITYFKMHFLAPFDSQLIIEGDFPHARFMSYHISSSFDPQFPHAANRGQLEVPIIDVDIDPDSGNVNPFRIGQDRNAQNRRYHVYFDLKKGNMVDLNPVLQNEHFRAPGNTRVGGPFTATGPLGDGSIAPPVIWLRYYVPDKGTEPLAEVSIPKAKLKLSTGEEFWLQPDFSFAAQRQTKIIPGYSTPLFLKVPEILGPDFGWEKMFDIILIWMEGRYRQLSEPYGPYPEEIMKRELQKTYTCYTNKWYDKETPGSIAHSATDCPYNHYIRRTFAFTRNHVYAIHGKLPTTPTTRDGDSTTHEAQARYLSFCRSGLGEDDMYNGLQYGCLIDEDIVKDENNDYILVYAKGNTRPSNAREECGVTWQEIGPESQNGLMFRWMSVYPDHYMDEYAPNDENIPWEVGIWSVENYDINLIGRNKPGVMGPYHPVISHLSVQEFEALGCPVDANMIPKWE